MLIKLPALRIHQCPRADSLRQNRLRHGKAAVVVALDVVPVADASGGGVFRIDFHKGLGVELAQQWGAEPLRVNAIARALAMNPRVMLYDEPTSALDPELVGEVLHVMKELDAEGMTQIIVTHEMKFAKDASDYIIFMDKGEIVEYEDGDILFANPKNERTRAFLRHFVNAGVIC